MELNQLQYFKVVAETEHITHAAEKLNISQPALSRTILRLEENVGTKLFDREKNRIILNDAGKILLRRAERALMEIDDGVKEVQALNKEKSNQIKFSITESGFITAPLVSYMMNNPDLHVEQYIQSCSEIKKSIENGEIDFGITFSPIESDIIEWTPLISEEVLAFVGVEHPFAKKDYISLSELKNERFIFNNSSYNIRHKICEYCRRI
ncbi:MAG: LysR family transcriptional regulator, partial [Spirochaetales bacterium]|nr:LysR family transcriptional regulator [Spirochaetales bacterium]